jgi:branched-chain amino acid transport system substrate-binding protein
LTQGIITDSGLPAPGEVSNSWVRLFGRIRDQYIPAIPFDGNVLSGMAGAYAFTEALAKAGPNPSRSDLISAISTGLAQGPAVAPLAYGAASHDGMTGAWIGRISDGRLIPLTGVMTAGPDPAGAVAPYAVPQPAAPASGMPLR